MGAMTSAYDIRSTMGRFRLVAFLEAASWVGLLVGMFFKHLMEPGTEIGVKIFGPVHGAVFVAFLAAAMFAGIAARWTLSTWIWSLVASVVPLGTVIFLIWADRTGRLVEVPDEAAAAAAPGADSPVR
jgi:integral membrane protein